MSDADDIGLLRHRLRNVEAQNIMLRRLVDEAAERLEAAGADDCSAAERAAAMQSASRLRRATAGDESLSGG